MKRTLSIVLGLLLVTSMVYAASSDTATFSGTIAEVNDILVANENVSLDLSGAEANVKIFDITGSNNSATGFSLTFSSANAGQLRGQAYDIGKAGTFIDYTVNLVESTPPSSATTNEILAGLDLSAGDQVINYDLTVSSATEGAVWNVQINHAAKTLFADTYADTVTITIANF